VLDAVEALIAERGREARCSGFKLGSRPGALPEAIAYFYPGSLQPATRDELAAALEALPWIRRVSPRRASLGWVFADELVAELGGALGRGEVPSCRALEVWRGRRFAVGFLDPNLSKALHVGHLRNIVLGHGYAALLAASGARVTRRACLSDVGRSVFEALCGVFAGDPDRRSVPAGHKPDHFVGRCYARYAAGLPAPDPAIRSPIAAEVEVHGDPAEQAMRRWAAGDTTVRRQWGLILDWALAGQRESLRRLGVAIDEFSRESEALGELDLLVAEGLASGVLARDPQGNVVYLCERPDFPSLTLLRHDGCSTEYGRLLAVLSRDQALAETLDSYVSVVGDEWKPAGAVFEEALRRLRPCPLFEKISMVYHGMVLLDGSTMKSRDGKALLLDDFWERLLAAEPVQALAGVSGAPGSPELVADVLTKLSFLAGDPRRPISFDWERFIDPRRNPAWSVARALCRALAESERPPAPGDPRDPWFRVLALQGLAFPRVVASAVEGAAFRGLIAWLRELSARYLEAPAGAACARVAGSLLAAGLGALGVGTPRLLQASGADPSPARASATL
jgi:arginyl-tRNA synthetase